MRPPDPVKMEVLFRPHMHSSIAAIQVFSELLIARKVNQNLVRFLYGDIRADGFLDIDDLTLPPDVQQEYDKGNEVRASYFFEITVSLRGKQWQLHRRTMLENSAISRRFDELFPAKGET